MDTACVIGYGVVGKATATLFGIKKHFDIDEKKSNITLEEAADCRYVFICLPTPVKGGNYIVSDILAIIQQINDYKQKAIFIIRSTVWPGFAIHAFKEIRPESIISNPEFLSEDTWEKDIKYPPFVVIGGADGRFREEVKALYVNKNKQADIVLTDNDTAEVMKWVMNGWYSTKIIFANQIYDWCQKEGYNYERIREMLEKHPLGMKGHNVIHYKGKRGVNGKCLPKDLEAFENFAHLPLITKVKEINDSTA